MKNTATTVKSKVTRRKFVKEVALVGTAVGLSPVNLFGKTPEPKTITIIGAGLAGLSAGYELKQLGHKVTILEARDRVGGKVFTIREPFSEGLHVQAGGTSFWSFKNDIVKEYIKRFNLRIAKPLNPEGLKAIDYYRGGMVEKIWNTSLTWYDGLNSNEQDKTLSELQAKYITPIVDNFLDNGYPEKTSFLIEKYDKVSVLEVFKQLGASDSAIKLLINKNFDFMGKDLNTISAFFHFSTYANFRLLDGPGYQIEGGNDILPKAFAKELEGDIQLRSVVQKIKQTQDKTIVSYWSEGQTKAIESDYLVIAIPFSVLEKIKGISKFSREKKQAIRGLNQLATCPVFIQTKKAFWKENGYSGNIRTDLPIGNVWPGNVPEGREEGLLEVFITSEVGIKLAKIKEEERIQFVLAELEKVLPGIKEQFVKGSSKAWINDPYALGCSAYFRVGEVKKYYPHFSAPEGRIHFAGGHTAPLHLFGFMQGCILSGIRVANEINQG